MGEEETRLPQTQVQTLPAPPKTYHVMAKQPQETVPDKIYRSRRIQLTSQILEFENARIDCCKRFLKSISYATVTVSLVGIRCE
jgi:hypothetical protein